VLGAIFIGVPISFTLLFLALRFGYIGMGATVFDLAYFQTIGMMKEELLRGRAAVHLHGLHHRAGGPDGAAVHGVPHDARAGARRALSRRSS
jgi:hypothetical protein